MKSLFFFLILTAAQAQQPAKPIVLNRDVPLRSGTVLREVLDIRVVRGSTQITAKSGNRQLSTRWFHRYNFARRIQGGGAEEIDIREHVCQTGNFNGTTPPPSAEDFGPLNSKTLRARRRTNGWEYSLKDVKPTPADLNCMLDLGFISGLLEIIPTAIGTQAHKPTETWKTTIPVPRGKAYGIPAIKDLETTFGSLEDRPDGQHAHLFITGSFTMQRPMAFNAVIDVTFAVALTRRLSDMVDVETKITGSFKNTYPALYRADENAPNEPATFTQDLPYTITRTLKLENK